MHDSMCPCYSCLLLPRTSTSIFFGILSGLEGVFKTCVTPEDIDRQDH